MSALHKGDVIQFNNNHKWCGCFGFVDDVKESVDDVLYLIGVPVPGKGMQYIASMVTNDEFNYVGRAAMIPLENKEE